MLGGGRRRREAAALDAALTGLREELAATRAQVAQLAAESADTGRADPATELAVAPPVPPLPAPPEPAPAALLVDPDWLRALGVLASACEGIAEELRADRRSRAELRDAVATLAALLAAPTVVEPRSTVLGGSVDPTAPREIVLDADGESPHDGVEVRCRFGDHWVSGFDVVDVVEDEGEMRYRLRRRSDGCVLPAVFAAADVRFFTTAPSGH